MCSALAGIPERESITVNGHRHIRIMLGGNKKPAFKEKATTFWLKSETDNNTYNQGLHPIWLDHDGTLVTGN